MKFDLMYRHKTNEKFKKIRDIDLGKIIEIIKEEADKDNKLIVKIFRK